MLPLTDSQSCEGPWNPGLQSSVPSQFRPLVSLFRKGNTRNELRELLELSDYCGVPPQTLAEFSAQRLVIHEVLIRVTADVQVPDGPKYEDLGITFRSMVSRLLERHLAARIVECERLLDDLKQRAIAAIKARVAQFASGEVQPSARAVRWPARQLRRLRQPRGRSPPKTASEDDLALIAAWQRESALSTDDFDKACLDALTTIAMAISGRHGRLPRNSGLVPELAARLVCNDYGSLIVGHHIAPSFQAGVAAEGYRLLPCQADPYVMNIKGASASGKSTMRPLQRALAERLGVPWADFSLISPDIWRKFLIDYQGLGPAYKYAGALSAQELEIVDRKLDRYIARKAARGILTHLLIDRFRFDSFVPDADVNSKLLTRFGSYVFLQFMITPPEATVERAWERGRKVGRYKAVDDLLAHNVEAYSGMPELFFTWALSRSKRVHYEFLDNSVPIGSRPRTIAYGVNGEMNILDLKSMVDIERFRRINVEAVDPASVHVERLQNVALNLEFLRRCISLLPRVNVADWKTGELYLRFENGRLAHLHPSGLAAASKDPVHHDVLHILLADLGAGAQPADGKLPPLDPRCAHTIGIWGEAATA